MNRSEVTMEERRNIMTRRRHRRRANIQILQIASYLMLGFLSLHFILVRGAVITNGPEDKFFCGWEWDDEDCPNRQHCPSGRSEECDGFEEGQKCFANTKCDTKFGHGDWYTGLADGSSGQNKPRPPRPSPGGTARPVYEGKSDDPTDHYFCGISIDDARNKCATNCPSGQSIQCPQGEICFFDVLACDARNMIPPTMWPTYEPPTKSPFSGPTKIPTEMPIPPPEPLDFPSDDPSDHWFCGETINQANDECRVHCPTALECPMGQICYFGTKCDARTYAPTPPPTRRPTKPPTEFPTMHPTETMGPTLSPTTTSAPTLEPTEQIPTRSPTQSPTKRPTYAPMPSLQSSFFCGIDWNDAINNCKKRCPTGEDPECPFDEHCFSMTPCTEEKGYPDSYYDDDDDAVETDGGGKPGEPEACVPLEVTITADHWPKETSWIVEDIKTGDILAEGGNDVLVPGEAISYPVKCINNKFGCFLFTIKDTGGDGICCEHGNGSYTVKYDGEVIKTGSAFYDDEKTDFGLCGQSEAPTPSPTSSSQNSGSSSTGGTAFRCVPKPLVQGGYMISVDKCKNFVNCYNPHINIGDDWFCDKDAECVEAPNCDGAEEVSGSSLAAGGSYRCVADELAGNGYVVSKEKCDFFDPCYNKFIHEGDDFFCAEGFSCIEASDCAEEKESTPAEVKPPTNRPTESNVPPPPTPSSTSTSTVNETPKTASPSTKDATVPARPIVTRPPRPTNPPTPSPTQFKSSEPTFVPTTYRPTYGPCDGAACNERDHCRSQYGFCGPGETYCNDDAIWSKDCPDPEPSPPPTSAETKPPPTNPPVLVVFATEPPSTGAFEQTTSPPSTQKPIWSKPKPTGGGKPKPSGGGKPKPIMTTPDPTREPSLKPTEAQPQPTMEPSSSPHSMVDTFLINNPQSPKTPNPTAAITVDYSTKPATPATVTDPPSVGPTSDEKPINEFECTGDPCPVDIHCRSRYGSCGPGFVYCNLQSIWTSECPPIIPGVTPTRNPTRKPTKSPSTVDTPPPTPVKFGIPNIVLDKEKPTLPPLPKPTLSVVSGGSPLTPSFFSGPTFAETDKNDEEESEKKEGVGKDSAHQSKLDADFVENSGEENAFESEEYLDSWIKMRDEWTNNATSNLTCGFGWTMTLGFVFYFYYVYA